MTEVVPSTKACAVNPLKVSPALGGAMAFLGVDGSLPLFHGSQGCTAFALVLMVRHFHEAIPLQTTAMSELTTILGGADNVEAAIGNIRERNQPKLIGILSTALTETRGEDIGAELKAMRERHPEWHDLDLVYASTPDYGGSLEEGWGASVKAMIETLVPEERGPRTLRQVNVLAGSHLTPADAEEIREIIESFGLSPLILPDLAGSLDGHVPDHHIPTSLGGTPPAAIRELGRSAVTFAMGEHMRPAAEALTRRTGVPFRLFDHVTGLAASDAFIAALMEVSGTPAPERVKRERSRLIDAMLDGHFFFEGKHIAIAAESDLLLAVAALLAAMGAHVGAAVIPCPSPAAARVPAARVLVGDLGDLEKAAHGCDLVIANSHARELAERLGLPLFRLGFPVFDRLGGPQRVSVGYRGTRCLIFDLANLLLDHAAGAHAAVGGNAHELLEEEHHAQAQAG
ncbi:MAG: nitrogenase iron-molybdenum cofactor biosynthesis protein NifN [Rhodospirillales bacterium]|nr:nitrogenase iron-molybdenum cofactor biosynthesis protein NifN [Rhodospirillales bacterium]